jgi:hypothetical protein
MFGKSRILGRYCAAGLVSVGLVFVVTHAAIGSEQPLDSDPSTPVFTIASSISSSSLTQTTALLYPGVQRYLWYTVFNPQQVAISVDSLSIGAVTPALGCPAANLDLGQTSFTGNLVVPPLSTNDVSVPISLIETNSNQNRCENVSFTFTYVGSAFYIEVYATTVVVTSSLNPSPPDQAVTYTATVIATPAAGQDPVPNSPTGTVGFFDGTQAICSGAALLYASATSSTATCSPPAYVIATSHSITAEYSNIDGNFSDSTSPIYAQVVGP